MNETLQVPIYAVCFITSAACAWLLMRGYRRSGARLLFWCALCFAFLSVNNLAVLFDIVVFADTDLQFLRHAASLAAVMTLLFGLVWESE